MSNNLSLKEKVENLVLFANRSKNLDNVIEEVLNFVRNENKNAILEFLKKDKYEGFFCKREGETTTELSER